MDFDRSGRRLVTPWLHPPGREGAGESAHRPTRRIRDVLSAFALIAIAALLSGAVAGAYFTAAEMYVVWPVIVAVVVFSLFSVVLIVGWQLNPLSEIGFVYLGIAVLYTVMPALKFLSMHLKIPAGFCGLTSLDWTPREMGVHFWRQVLLTAGVVIGYLVLRRRPTLTKGDKYRLDPAAERALGPLAVIVAGCVITITVVTGGVSTYMEHYARLDSLSSFMRRLVYLLLAVKAGSYYVLLTWMFGRYRKYRARLLILVTAICAYEIVYSHGSRIVACFVIIAYIGLYNVQVRPIRLRQAAVVGALLALGFVSIESVRFPGNVSLERFKVTLTSEHSSEFEAVYATGYHLYNERAHSTLPSPPALMGIYELVAIVPFLDHTTSHPMYWYAREYFPDAEVPPATMGIVAMSAVWGGEWNLLAQGLLIGFLYALVVRWFERLRGKWWALSIYVFLYATCVMTLKYSLLYQFIPFVQILAPALVVAAALIVCVRPYTSAASAR